MVASYMGAPKLGAPTLGSDCDPVSSESLANKPSRANCGPMTQQGMMGAHGHEMHPQGFLRLVGCHETGRQKQRAAQRQQV